MEKDAEKWEAPHIQHSSVLTHVLVLRLTALSKSLEVSVLGVGAAA